MKYILTTLSILLIFCGVSFADVTAPDSLVSVTSTTTNHTTIVTGSFTPAANTLLIACVAALANDNEPDISISDSFSESLSWTEVTVSAATRNTVSIFYAVKTTSASGTITATFSTNADRSSMTIVSVTGHDTGTPIAENATAVNTNDTISAALADLASGSLALSACLSRADTDGITEGSNETEISEITSGSTNETRLQIQYNLGTDVTLNTSDLNTSANIIIAIEISPAAGVTRRFII